MTKPPPLRSFEHLRTVARLGSLHLFIARATMGEEKSLAVLFDKHDTPGDWIVLSRYPDTPAGMKAADTVARLFSGPELRSWPTTTAPSSLAPSGANQTFESALKPAKTMR